MTAVFAFPVVFRSVDRRSENPGNTDSDESDGTAESSHYTRRHLGLSTLDLRGVAFGTVAWF